MTLFPAQLDTDEDEREEEEDFDTDDSHERDDDVADDLFSDDSSDDSGGDGQEGVPSREAIEELRNKYSELQRRFAGQSRRINEDARARATLETQWQTERAQLLEAVLLERTQDLPQEEQQAKLQELRHALWMESQGSQLTQREQQLGEAGRELYIHRLASQYDVPVEELANFPTAESMEWYAQREASRKRKDTQSRKRNTQRQKNSDTRRQTSAPPKEPKTLDDAESEFMRLSRRRR